MATDTTSLADRIIKALAEAGIDGLDEDSLLESLHEAVVEDLGEDAGRAMDDATTLGILDDLEKRGVVRSVGCNHWTLSHAEWAQRIQRIALDYRPTGAPPGRSFVTDVEQLLAGTEA